MYNIYTGEKLYPDGKYQQYPFGSGFEDVFNKYEKEVSTKEDDKIDKYTLQKWLLEKAI